MNILRWILTPMLAPLGYVVAVYLAIVLTGHLHHLCPADAQVSGRCTLPWYPTAEMAAFSVATAAGAAVWVLLPVLVAPAHKARVAWVAYACGAAVAAALAILARDLWWPLASALAAGAGVAWFAGRRWRR